MPSACGAGCTDCTPPATPQRLGAVGTYGGGKYSDCGIYRPLPDCKMRTLAAPFCPVCAGVIRTALAIYQPAESINLLTPSISFANVPEGIGGTGVTTWRAVTFEVVTCRPLVFQIIAGPTGGFGTPLGTTANSGPDEIGPVDRVHCGCLTPRLRQARPARAASPCAATRRVRVGSLISQRILLHGPRAPSCSCSIIPAA